MNKYISWRIAGFGLLGFVILFGRPLWNWGFFAFAGLLPLFYLLFWTLFVMVQVLFAAGIFRDALAQKAADRLFFVEPPVWAIATLAGGLFTVALYWIFHYSTLRDG